MDFVRRTISAQLHFLGLILATFGLIYLCRNVSLSAKPQDLWICCVYGLSGIFLFFVSSTYHFLHDGIGLSKVWADRFENLDHFAIYFFIAGSYSAILINTVVGPWLSFMLIAIWCIAIFGVLYTLLKSKLPAWAQRRWLYTGLFVAMGWLLLLHVGEVVRSLEAHSLLTPFFLGAFCYSFGALLYAIKWPQLIQGFFGFHEIWHLLVLAGYLFHLYVVCAFYPLAV